MDKQIKIGVLALQGDFKEHIHILRKLDTDAVEVRLPGHIQTIDGLIIPGGESTTIGKLAARYNLVEPLREFAAQKPVWGTCAGMIFLAKHIDMDQPLLGVMDIEVERNAFGRQIDSFKSDLVVSILNNGKTKPFPAIFIRAPKIAKVNGKAKVVARLSDGTAVAAQEEKWLATSFHPELTDDHRFHVYFVNMVKGSISGYT